MSATLDEHPGRRHATVGTVGWMGLVNSLAWPAIVLIVFFFLRTPIATLIPRLRKISGPGGWGADFDQATEKVEAAAQSLAEGYMPIAGGGSAPPAAIPNRLETVDGAAPLPWEGELLRLAEISPATAIMRAYPEVEAEIVRLAKPYGQPLSVMGAARTLASADVIPKSMVPVLDTLSVLKNRVIQSPERMISPSAATSYVNAIANVVRILEPSGGGGQPPDPAGMS